MRDRTGELEYHGVVLAPKLIEAAPRAKDLYQAFLHLDRKSVLPFSFQSLVHSFILSINPGAATAGIISLLEQLDKDFPDLATLRDVSDVFIPAMFFKAERQALEDLEQVKVMMGRHTVTSASILRACLRNGCRSVTPIRYGVAFVEGFDLHAFVEELMEVLLLQPYRGMMLRELDRYFAQMEDSIDYHKLIATAVERQGVFHHRAYGSP